MHNEACLFGTNGHAGCILSYMFIYATYFLYIFALMLVAYYQYKIFLNFDIIVLNVLLSDLTCTKVAVYFQNRSIANLSLL